MVGIQFPSKVHRLDYLLKQGIESEGEVITIQEEVLQLIEDLTTLTGLYETQSQKVSALETKQTEQENEIIQLSIRVAALEEAEVVEG